MVLVPGTNYLLANDVLDSLGLWIHTALKVFVCRECECALTFSIVKGHLRGKRHRIKLKPEQEDELERAFHAGGVFESPGQVNLPSPGGPPVQAISRPVEGNACAEKGCTYCVRDWQRMLLHSRDKHGRSVASEVLRRSAMMQVLFLSANGVYFEVDVDATAAAAVNLRNYLRTNFIVAPDLEQVVTEDADRDRLPLLKLTQWDRFMPEIREHRGERRAAQALKAGHLAEEVGGAFGRLQQVVTQHHAIIRQALDKCGQSFTVQKVLKNGPGFGAQE